MKRVMGLGLAVLAVAVFLFLAGQASAEEIVSLENRNLVVKEVKTVKTVPDVPAGISAETAYKLVTGELKEAAVKNKEAEKITERFSYPLKKEKIFSNTVITYDGGKWIKKTVVRTEVGSDWPLTVFWLWVPSLGILITSLVNVLLNIGKRKLFVFYLAMFAGMFAGVIAGGLAGVIAGGLAGVVAGVVAGMFAGGLAGVIAGAFAGGGGFAGMFAGGLAGGLAGIFAGQGNYEIVLYYLVFLLAVEVVSFAGSLFAAAVKKRLPAILPAIKKWVEAK